MRVMVIGGSGALGRPLVRQLCAAGHQTWVMSRDPARAGRQIDQRAQVLRGNLLNAGEVRRAMEEVMPEVVMHQATAIPDPVNPRKVARDMEATTRLRREGTRNLVAALNDHPETRLIAQSVCFAYAPQGPPVLSEDAPLNLSAPADFRPVVQGVAELEDLTLNRGGVVLRYGNFYGPATTYAPGGGTAQRVRKRGLPVVGDGGGVFSFVHVDDAAAATVAAMKLSGPAVLNVADDDPAPVREWLPALAAALGAKPPRRVPVWLTRLAVSEWGVEYMTRLRGASNQRAKERLAWQPRRRSWREGFLEMAKENQS